MPPPNHTLTAQQLIGCIVHHAFGVSYVISAYDRDVKLAVIKHDIHEWVRADSVSLLIPKSDLLALADSIHQAAEQVPHA